MQLWMPTVGSLVCREAWGLTRGTRYRPWDAMTWVGHSFIRWHSIRCAFQGFLQPQSKTWPGYHSGHRIQLLVQGCKLGRSCGSRCSTFLCLHQAPLSPNAQESQRKRASGPKHYPLLVEELHPEDDAIEHGQELETQESGGPERERKEQERQELERQKLEKQKQEILGQEE